MARVAPLNPAVCTSCGETTTQRVGYSKRQAGSVWLCKCGHVFVVPTLVLSQADPKKSP
jgi:ribosomal protein L37AE/L43A